MLIRSARTDRLLGRTSRHGLRLPLMLLAVVALFHAGCTRTLLEDTGVREWVERSTPPPKRQSLAGGMAEIDELLAKGEAAAALERAGDLSGRFPTDATVRQKLAKMLIEADQPEAALVQLEEAQRLRPDDVEVMVDRGQLLKQQGRTKESARVLRAALVTQPNHHRAAATLRDCVAAEPASRADLARKSATELFTRQSSTRAPRAASSDSEPTDRSITKTADDGETTAAPRPAVRPERIRLVGHVREPSSGTSERQPGSSRTTAGSSSNPLREANEPRQAENRLRIGPAATPLERTARDPAGRAPGRINEQPAANAARPLARPLEPSSQSPESVDETADGPSEATDDMDGEPRSLSDDERASRPIEEAAEPDCRRVAARRPRPVAARPLLTPPTPLRTQRGFPQMPLMVPVARGKATREPMNQKATAQKNQPAAQAESEMTSAGEGDVTAEEKAEGTAEGAAESADGDFDAAPEEPHPIDDATPAGVPTVERNPLRHRHEPRATRHEPPAVFDDAASRRSDYEPEEPAPFPEIPVAPPDALEASSESAGSEQVKQAEEPQAPPAPEESLDLEGEIQESEPTTDVTPSPRAAAREVETPEAPPTEAPSTEAPTTKAPSTEAAPRTEERASVDRGLEYARRRAAATQPPVEESQPENTRSHEPPAEAATTRGTSNPGPQPATQTPRQLKTPSLAEKLRRWRSRREGR